MTNGNQHIISNMLSTYLKSYARWLLLLAQLMPNLLILSILTWWTIMSLDTRVHMLCPFVSIIHSLEIVQVYGRKVSLVRKHHISFVLLPINNSKFDIFWRMYKFLLSFRCFLSHFQMWWNLSIFPSHLYMKLKSYFDNLIQVHMSKSRVIKEKSLHHFTPKASPVVFYSSGKSQYLVIRGYSCNSKILKLKISMKNTASRRILRWSLTF